jgi:hypothetical protein
MYLATVQFALYPHDEAGFRQPVHQFNRAVVFDEQPGGKFPDGRCYILRQALQCQQELMLFGLDAGLSGNALAERNKLPDLPAEFRQMAVIFSREISACNHLCRVTNALLRTAAQSSFHSRDEAIQPEAPEKQEAGNDRARTAVLARQVCSPLPLLDLLNRDRKGVARDAREKY